MYWNRALLLTTIKGFKHIKYCFLDNSPFLLPLAVVCVQLDTDLEIFQLISGQKIWCYLGGDKGGRGSRRTVTKSDKGGVG